MLSLDDKIMAGIKYDQIKLNNDCKKLYHINWMNIFFCSVIADLSCCTIILNRWMVEIDKSWTK